MNRRSCGILLVAGLMFAGVANMARADESVSQMAQVADQSIAVAQVAIDEAKAAIEKAKQLVAIIPADSPHMGEVTEILASASENWTTAVAALDGAKQSAARITSASSADIAKDYKLLATVNSRVAFSGARVVQTGLFFIDSVASNRSESLDLIRLALQDAVAATSQVQFNYDRVKELIAKKYSK